MSATVPLRPGAADHCCNIYQNTLLMFFNVNLDAVTKSAVILQNFDYFAPLTQMRVSISKDKIAECGKKIKEVYYGKLNPSATNEESYYVSREITFC